NGIGIKSELKDKIFDMYFRGTEQSKGNGLGLYVTKKAIEKSLGKVNLESEENEFTQFSFVFPLL
ncbi:MAG: HAMP domain-containing histidine kinase, partial [Cytophagales bacterium]|nr:HAMP domain-containing histidine kinase [Cytophagales bacterium]